MRTKGWQVKNHLGLAQYLLKLRSINYIEPSLNVIAHYNVYALQQPKRIRLSKVQTAGHAALGWVSLQY